MLHLKKARLCVLIAAQTSIAHSSIQNDTLNPITAQLKTYASQIITTIVTMGCAHYVLAHRKYELPKPTGPYTVGTIRHHLIDHNRTEPHVKDPHIKREIMLQIWYPCKHTEPATTYPHLEQALPYLKTRAAQEYMVPKWLLKYCMGDLYCHAIPNAKPLGINHKFPLILFSHGMTGLVDLNSVHIENLVSHGYVVIGISHTYDSLITLFPDGRAVQLYKGAKRTPEEYAFAINTAQEDVAFVVNNLSNLPISHLFDFDRMGFFGFCAGGILGIQECCSSTPFKALVNLDGWNPVIEKCTITPPTIPTLLFRHDSSIQSPHEISDTRNLIPLFNHLTHDAYLITISGSQHRDFSDIPFIKEASLEYYTRYLKFHKPVRAERISGIINTYIVDFFNTYLKGLKAAVLNQESPYPEVTFLRK